MLANYFNKPMDAEFSEELQDAVMVNLEKSDETVVSKNRSKKV